METSGGLTDVEMNKKKLGQVNSVKKDREGTELCA